MTGTARVAFLTHPWARALPPSESVAIWTEAVAARLAARHEVTVWSRDREGAGRPLRHDEVEYRFVRARGDDRLGLALRRADRFRHAGTPLFATRSYHGVYHAQLLRELRRTRPDVIHVPTFSQLIGPLRRACPASAVVLHVRDEMSSRLDPRLLRRRLPRAHAVVGCSAFVARGLADRCPEAAERIRAIPNGVDPALFTPAAARAPREPVRFLYVGRISPEKGTHVLLEAFAALARERPVELDLVGEEAIPPPDMLALLGGREMPRVADGYLEPLLERLPAEARARVRLLGKHPHAQLPAFYRDADVVVLPSLAEAFGIPAVEAMACGLPVVAARTGGIPEAVVDGETGLLVPPGDAAALARALARLADDSELRVRLGAAGRVRAVAEFSYDRVAQQIETLYDELGRSQ